MVLQKNLNMYVSDFLIITIFISILKEKNQGIYYLRIFPEKLTFWKVLLFNMKRIVRLTFFKNITLTFVLSIKRFKKNIYCTLFQG